MQEENKGIKRKKLKSTTGNKGKARETFRQLRKTSSRKTGEYDREILHLFARCFSQR